MKISRKYVINKRPLSKQHVLISKMSDPQEEMFQASIRRLSILIGKICSDLTKIRSDNIKS